MGKAPAKGGETGGDPAWNRAAGAAFGGGGRIFFIVQGMYQQGNAGCMARDGTGTG